MTTATLGHRTRGSFGFRAVAQMEWHKPRTARSTWYIAAGMIVLAMLVLSHESYAQMCRLPGQIVWLWHAVTSGEAKRPWMFIGPGRRTCRRRVHRVRPSPCERRDRWEGRRSEGRGISAGTRPR
jgi:hypothetical protein